MPRRARISIPGVPWHIIQRGNNKTACFFDDEDYALYLHHLKEQAEKYGCKIHAYALMTNHVHLLLTPEEENSASMLMKNLGQRYVQYINRTYKRSGYALGRALQIMSDANRGLCLGMLSLHRAKPSKGGYGKPSS